MSSCLWNAVSSHLQSCHLPSDHVSLLWSLGEPRFVEEAIIVHAYVKRAELKTFLGLASHLSTFFQTSIFVKKLKEKTFWTRFALTKNFELKKSQLEFWTNIRLLELCVTDKEKDCSHWGATTHIFKCNYDKWRHHQTAQSKRDAEPWKAGSKKMKGKKKKKVWHL